MKNKVIHIRVSEVQEKTIEKLKYKYKINTSNFIRDAIKEKIERDYSNIKIKIKNPKCQF